MQAVQYPHESVSPMSIFNTDTVTLQTVSITSVAGALKKVWTPSTNVKCDVQDLDKDKAQKVYGLQQNTDYLQVFDGSNAAWVLGNQVLYSGSQYIVRRVQSNMQKLALSNLTFIILEKVI